MCMLYTVFFGLQAATFFFFSPQTLNPAVMWYIYGFLPTSHQWIYPFLSYLTNEISKYVTLVQ